MSTTTATKAVKKIGATEGATRRNGAAIQVGVDLAATVAVGDLVEFRRLAYRVKGLGGAFALQTGARCRYLYVERVDPADLPGALKSPFHVREAASARGRRIEMARAAGVYNEPAAIHVEVKPRLKQVVVTTWHNWFSESRGYGGSSRTAFALGYSGPADPVLVAATGFVGGDDAALLALADAIDERSSGSAVENHRHRTVRRFCELAAQEDAFAYIRKQHRDARFADRRFAAGDRVTCHNRPGEVFEVVAVRFCEMTTQWRVGVRGMEAPQAHFMPAPPVAEEEG